MARTDQTLMDKRAFAERMLAPMVNPGEGGQNAHHSNFRYYLANAQVLQTANAIFDALINIR